MEYSYAGKPNFISNMIDEMVAHVKSNPGFNKNPFDSVTNQLEFRTIAFQLVRQSGRTTSVIRRVIEHSDSIMVSTPSVTSFNNMIQHFKAEYLVGDRIWTRQFLTDLAVSGRKISGIERVYLHDSIRQRGYHKMVRELLSVLDSRFILIKI